MFRGLKKLAEVVTGEEKPGFDTGLLDSQQISFTTLTATCSHPTLPSWVISLSRTRPSFTPSAKKLFLSRPQRYLYSFNFHDANHPH